MSSIPGDVISAIEVLEDQGGLLADHADHAARLASAAGEALAHAEERARSGEEASSALASQAAALLAVPAETGQCLAAGRRSLDQVKCEVNALGSGMAEASRLAERMLAATGRVCELVERIDLVALNAAIEAVRAGDAGKGFAVVASEMQTLAADAIKASEDLAEAARRVTLSTAGAHAAFAGAEGVIAGLDREVAAADDAMQAHAARLERLGEDARAVADAGHGVATALAGAAEPVQALRTRATDVSGLTGAFAKATGEAGKALRACRTSGVPLPMGCSSSWSAG